VMTVAQAMWDKISPDLWMLGDGEEDYDGLLNFCSFHYLNQGVTHGSWSLPEGIAHPVNGGFHYSPDCFFINGSAKEPQHGTVLSAMIPSWTYGENACSETETFWFFGSQNGIYSCAYLGDKAAVSANHQFFTGRGMAWTKASLDAYRDMDMAFIGGIYWRSFLATGVQGVTFILPQQEIRYFSRARFDKRLSIFDDEFKPGELVFTWQLLDEKGQKVAGKETKMTSTTKFLHRDRVRFRLPKVRERTLYTLTLNLVKDGLQRAYEERRVEVWPALKTVKVPLRTRRRKQLLQPGSRRP